MAVLELEGCLDVLLLLLLLGLFVVVVVVVLVTHWASSVNGKSFINYYFLTNLMFNLNMVSIYNIESVKYIFIRCSDHVTLGALNLIILLYFLLKFYMLIGFLFLFLSLFLSLC